MYGTSYYYDNSGRLTQTSSQQEGGYNYIYDNNGNLLRKNPSNNLLLNPNFEMIDKNNVFKSDSWDSVVNKNTKFEIINTLIGGRNQRVSDLDMSLHQYSGISQQIQVVGGEMYSATTQILVQQISGAVVQLYIDFLDNQQRFVSANSTESKVVGEYTTLNLRDNIPQTAVSARIYIILRAKSAGASGSFMVSTANFEYGTKQNILVNGNLEKLSSLKTSVAEGWSSVAIAYTGFEIINDMLSGERVQRVWDSKMEVGQLSGLSQRIHVIGGRPYVASMQVQFQEKQGASVQLYIDFLDEQGRYIGAQSTETAVSGEYVTLNIKDTIPANAETARVYCILRAKTAGASGKFVVRTANFEYGSKKNILANGNLETSGNQTTGLALGWTKVSAVNAGFNTIRDIGTGEKLQKVWDSNMSIGQFSGVSQRVQVTPGKEFSASSQLKIHENQGISVQLYLDFISSQGEFLGARSTEVTVVGKYVTLNIKDNIPASTETVRVYVILRAKSAGASGSFFLKSVSFEY